MSQIRVQSITSLGAFAAFDNTHADYIQLDPARCTGGADAPLRTTLEPAPGEDGSLIFEPFDDAQILTLVGDVFITSNGGSSEAGYFAAYDTLIASLIAALDAGKAAPIDLVHAGGTAKVWKYAPVEETWANYWFASVTFGVVVDVFA